MAFIRLDINGFRNLASVRLEPIPIGFNLISGNNGSGKTSLLEAIYYLSLGRSFRSALANRVINHGADKFSLFAEILLGGGQAIPVGIERQLQGITTIRIAGKDVNSTAELAALTPVQLINSHCYNLLDAPGFRRKYLDWGVFYLNNDFLRVWRQFDRALRQRNAALRGQLSRHELQPWTHELVESASQLDHIRQEYVAKLLPELLPMVHALLPQETVKIAYQMGWDSSFSYADALARSLERDFQLGYTQYGPHRADLKVWVEGLAAKDILSRGQQKLLVCAMLLAQGSLLQSDANKRPIYLVDDLPAELDAMSRASVMTLLGKQAAQIFVTAVERKTLDVDVDNIPTKMFHVEHGAITEIAND